MGNPNVKWYQIDKLIKDLIWDDLVEASKYAKGSMLDIGCGKSPYRRLFENNIESYTGLDPRSSVADIKQDFYKAKIKPNSYDTVLSTQVLEHVPEPEEFIRKVYRILKKKGIVIITVPFVGSLHEEPYDYFRYTPYSLTYLFSKIGFKIVYIKGQGNWLAAIATDLIFYLESSFNRFGFKYPKRILQLIIQTFGYISLKLPPRFTKPDLSPINYILVAEKK